MSESIVLQVMLIYILNIVNRLKTCFDFNINGFYHFYVSIIKLLAFDYLFKRRLKVSNLSDKIK